MSFQYGLCSCFGNLGVCIVTYLVPCYTQGRIAEKVGDNCLVCGLIQLIPIVNWYFATKIRGKVRSQKNIEGGFCTDCLTVGFCYCCALTQEAREVGAIGSGSMAINQEIEHNSVPPSYEGFGSACLEPNSCRQEWTADSAVEIYWESAGGASFVGVPIVSILSILASKTMHKLPAFSRGKVAGKQWVHPSESLTTGRVVYTVKFLGHVEVDHPKGSDMVREAIRKMKFNKQIKRAEGEKPPKIDLVISIDSILVQDPKFKLVQYQYPLHHVSYCADDKTDKRMFTFIAKDKDSDKHHCFVFDSDKCAEEITLTLGQAFDLAYQRFLESSSKNVDTKKQLLLLHKKVEDLTQENTTLKERVVMLEKLLDQKKVDSVNGGLSSNTKFQDNGAIKLRSVSSDSSNGQAAAPVTSPTSLPILAPPPPVPSRSHISPVSPSQQSNQAVDIFGSTPFSPTTPNSSFAGSSWPVTAVVSPVFSPGAITSPFNDPFGMQVFSPPPTPTTQFEVDRELMDMQAHFSRGLSIGTEDFSIDDLDPLKK